MIMRIDTEQNAEPSCPQASLVDLLRWRAANQPDQHAYSFLSHDGADTAYVSYADLDRQARTIAALLQREGLDGKRALLLYPPGLDYIAAFFGCLYAGVAAIPAYPPHPAHLERALPRLEAIIHDAQPGVALTTATIQPLTKTLLATNRDLAGLRWLATDMLDQCLADEWQAPWLDTSALALLQYTSGSTATPKGVMLTHANLMHNAELIHRSFTTTSDSRGVFWLPLYHDMGLIGGIVQPLYCGGATTLMSPIAFLQRPIRWLEAISRTRATISGGPNFAYDLCVRKITPEQRATLDLSSWEVAFTGAEPVRADTLERFAAAFEPYGFRRTAFYPCYGLAEATLFVTGGRVDAPPVIRRFDGASLKQHRAVAALDDGSGQRVLVGCGQSTSDQQLVIVHPEALTLCAPGQVGEIWLSGPSVAQGYWNRLDETERAFKATLAGHESQFFRTGDLGFVQHGELFITGRIKDLIIIRGRNHYPQDIELTAERSHEALRPGCGAAFSVEVGGDERLVIVYELERQHRNADIEEVAQTVRQAVAQQHEVQVYGVVLLRPGHIPKTSSGKIQHYACRAGFLDGTLDEVGRSVIDEVAEPLPTDASAAHLSLSRDALLAALPEVRQLLLEDYLRELIAQTLRVAPAHLDTQQPLLAMGLDSLTSIELQQRLDAVLGIDLPLTTLLHSSSIGKLATQILDRLADQPAGTSTIPAPAQHTLAEHPLTHSQLSLWFMHQLAPESTTNTLVFATHILTAVDIGALRRAFQALIDRHATLRTTFAARVGQPVQQIHAHAPVRFDTVDVAGWGEAQLNDRLAEEARQPFDLGSAPLLRVRLFTRSPEAHVLLLAVPHIAADFWSLAILARELGALYAAETSGIAATLPALPLGYTDYARWEAELLASPTGERLWSYWNQHLGDAPTVLNLPTDHPRLSTQTYHSAVHVFRLDSELNRALKTLSEQHAATLYMTLLAAFQILLYRYVNQEDFLVGSPVAGRGRAELAGLVGSFARPVVLRADLSGNPTFTSVLQRTRDTVLAALDHQEYPFALLVEQLQPVRDPSRSPLFQVMFNFLTLPPQALPGLAAYGVGIPGARIDLGGLQLESLVLEQPIDQFDLTLVLAELDGGLTASLQYNVDLFDAATIEHMGAHFRIVLEEIATQPDRLLSAILARVPRQKLPITVAATFTAEPLGDSLSFWMDQLRMPATLRFAPYNQVFQQLLDPASQLLTNDEGVNILLLRLEDWIGAGHGADAGMQELEQNVAAFMRSLQSAATASSTPYLIGVCPPSGRVAADPALCDGLWRLERLIAARLADMHGVYSLDIAGAAARYQVEETYDPYTDELGHIPFTSEFFAALGTTVARMIFALRTTPYKVIALDCDHTLWQGVCGEDGALGVQLTEQHLALQRFLVGQQQAGMLLCLCSKNNPEDVFEVFRRRPEMPLKLDHVVAWRLNWAPKSENLKALAHELQLSIDSFIFLDDNALEVAEVHARCPEVLALSLPADTGDISAFLDHVWAFDRFKVTAEDRRRTLMYQQNRQREALRATSTTLNDFLTSLNLQVTISPIQPDQVARVAELTQRTNQFNATTIRRTESELLQLLADATTECWVVEVSDRFGEYGLVGTIIFTSTANALKVDTFLLSCRVLGRRVEDTLLTRLAQIGQEHGCATLSIPYRPTAKNVPFLDFLRRVGGDLMQPQHEGFVFSAPVDAILSSQPGGGVPKITAEHTGPAGAAEVAGALAHADLISRIATHFRSAEQILAAMHLQKRSRPDLETPFVAPCNAVEEVLAGIWTEMLGVEQVGVDDNFFELGGHSLLAIQIISRLHDTFQIDTPLLSLFFEAPTVAGIASVIAPSLGGAQEVEKIAQVLRSLEQLSDEEVDRMLRQRELAGMSYE
jgi:FkbH-like protein